jgi:hypothetical protein
MRQRIGDCLADKGAFADYHWVQFPGTPLFAEEKVVKMIVDNAYAPLKSAGTPAWSATGLWAATAPR